MNWKKGCGRRQAFHPCLQPMLFQRLQSMCMWWHWQTKSPPHQKGKEYSSTDSPLDLQKQTCMMVEATSLLNKVLSDTGVWIALHPPGGWSGKVLVSAARDRVLKTILCTTVKVTARQFMISQSGSCDLSPDPWMSGFIVPARKITLLHIQLAMAVSFNSHYFPASSCASRKRIDSHHRNYPQKQRRISQTVVHWDRSDKECHSRTHHS